MTKSFYTILVFALLICCIGIASIYSGTRQREGEAWEGLYKRQMLWVLIGLGLFLSVYGWNYRRLWDLSYALYALALVFLLMVFLLGIVRLGAQRWLRFAGFNFQPSEFAKLIIVIFMARYFSRKSSFDTGLLCSRYGLMRALVLPLIFVGVPVLLIIEQPDLGSGLMVFVIFIAVLFLSRVKLRFILGLLLSGAAALPFAWHYLRGYQKERLLVFINPNIDPLGAGYTIIQSKIAIGSGWLLGKGWLSGTQSQLKFLPESHTDFIFATFCEEWGLLGSGALLFFYWMIIREGLRIASRTHDSFGRLLAYGVTMMLSIQVFVNIAMNMGLAPVVGLPLPLMSYGGSSIAVTLLSLGILANIDRVRGVF
jgi:rod shape determining protein RodA